MAVTVSTIAKHVGLSRQTVAFVLGDRPHKFRAETRERVFAAAAELGYRRNAASVAMSKGRYNAIGLLQSATASLGMTHANFFAATMEQVRAANMHMSLGQVDDATLTDESAMLELMNAWAVDGLMISYVANYPGRLVEILRRYRLPAIWTNVRRDLDAVYADDYAGARAATELLLKQGHRAVAFVRHYDSEHYSSHDRWAGYCEAMRSAGLEPRRIGTDLGSIVFASADAHTLRLAQIRQFLQAPDCPSAVVIDDELTAQLIVHACGMLGLGLGTDLSVVNISRDLASILGQVVTTAVVPTGDLGHAAVPLLLQKIESRETDLPSVVVPYRFVHADATCRAPVH
jgi:DNA-binding LacI/PurR family transcriptional regulator